MARVRNNNNNNNKNKMINPENEIKLKAEWQDATPERRKEIEAELAKIEREAERARRDFFKHGLIG
jgi:hypothetical protein